MKRTLILLALTLITSFSAFAQKLYQYEGTVKQAYNFWMYVPESYDAQKKDLPLIIFLHGKSLSGNDLSKVRKYGPLNALSYGRRINSLILAPQSPGDGWKPEKVNRLLDWAIENYSIDTTRIYIIGMSMGSYGTIDYVGTYPQRVTAAIAMCGGTTLKSCDKMVDVPLWIIHGTEDKAVPVAASDKVYSAICEAKADNQCHYDRLPGVNHSSLARMFYLNDTYDWLFSHTQKGKRNKIQPTFDLVSKLPNAYKGLQSNSVVITAQPGKTAAQMAEADSLAQVKAQQQKAAQEAAAAQKAAQQKAAQEAALRAQQQKAQQETAQPKPAQPKPTQPAASPAPQTQPKPATPSTTQSEAAQANAERLAKEKAAQEKAEQERIAREKAAKIAAQKKAAEEAAKKKAAEEAKKKAAEEAKKKAEAEAKKKAEEEAKRKAAEEAARKKAAEEAARKKAAEEAAKWHVVKAGESHWSIAQKHGISVAEFRKLNNLTEKSVIHPGQKLRVKK